MSGISKMGSGSPTGNSGWSWMKRYFKYWTKQWIERLQGPSKLRVYDSKILTKKKKLGQWELGSKISAVTHGKE